MRTFVRELRTNALPDRRCPRREPGHRRITDLRAAPSERSVAVMAPVSEGFAIRHLIST